MKAKFYASKVTAEDIEFGLLVGFADQESSTDDYLILQLADKNDDHDRRLGMATYYVERNDQGNSLYGGIQSCKLLRDRLKVTFDTRGVSAMGGVSTTEVSFSLDEAEFEEVRSMMRRCFAGTDCFVEGAV